MSDPIDRIVHAFPVSFFRSVLEQQDAAFMKAYRLAKQNISEPERRNALSQIRHACAEDGFRSAAQDTEISALACDTVPPGGRYSLVHSEGVYLLRCNIQAHCGTPRASKFRKQWSAVNAWLDPVQCHLFDDAKEPASDRLCGMLVVTANGRGGDPTVPAFVGLGIPRADLSAWKYLEPLTTLIGRYHLAKTPEATPVEVKDNAIPKLKHRTTRKTD